jgi:hypothetical protein
MAEESFSASTGPSKTPEVPEAPGSIQPRPTSSTAPTFTSYPGDNAGGFKALPSNASREGYCPLSMLAVLGFGLAALYSAFMVLAALLALKNGSPMFWAPWTLFLPVLPLLVSLAGYISVRRSENTRAGGSLAQYGMILSLLVGLSYIAYFAAVYFVIQAQSDAFAEKFFETLKNDDVDQAFLLGHLPEQRPDGKGQALHFELERQFNQGTDPSKWAFRNFPLSPLVQFVRQGGQDTRVEVLGSRVPEYAAGGYSVKKAYRITTPEGVMDIILECFGSDNRAGSGEREWLLRSYQMPNPKQPVQWSDLGRAIQRVRGESSQKFAKDWIQSLQLNDFATISSAAVGGNAPLGKLAMLPVLPGMKKPYSGREHFMTIDRDRFYDPSNADAVQELAEFGMTDAFIGPRMNVALDWDGSAVWYRNGDVLHLEHDLHFVVPLQAMDQKAAGKSGGPRICHVDGSIILEGNARILEDQNAEPNWRVLGVRLVRGRELDLTKREDASSSQPDRRSTGTVNPFGGK